MGRQAIKSGLPRYVSRHARTGLFQYYRRAPQGIEGPAFVRSFGTKDASRVHGRYGKFHDQAEKHFERITSGRSLSDSDLKFCALTLLVQVDWEKLPLDGNLKSIASFRRDFIALVDQRLGTVPASDMDRLLEITLEAYHKMELERTRTVRTGVVRHEQALRKVIPVPPVKGDSLTIMRAFEEAWKPAASRPVKSEDETKKYCEAFIELVGDHDLRDITRDHWSKWRAACLERHGPGSTAFKRFNMVKTVCKEAIRAGLIERKYFNGEDVIVRKPEKANLRNEGWSDDELRDLFTSDVFRHRDPLHGDAKYWVPIIAAHTGARLSEICGMQVSDVTRRHTVMTFFLAKESGKTEDSRRIIPVPQRLIDLGLSEYIKTLAAKGPLFPTIQKGSKNGPGDIISKWFGRYRKSLGLDRRGCDLHAFRHHLKTKLRDVSAPDQISDWITGHAAGNVGATYGRTEYLTAARYLDLIDLGVKLTAWSK